MISTAKYVKDIVIQDPDTGGDVEVTVFKHENGGIVAFDASYLDQVAEESSGGNPVVNDPFCEVVNDLVLEYPEETTKECISNGSHLKSCDDDGFCNECGYQ